MIKRETYTNRSFNSHKRYFRKNNWSFRNRINFDIRTIKPSKIIAKSFLIWIKNKEPRFKNPNFNQIKVTVFDYTSDPGKQSRTKSISSSLNLKLAKNLIHSSNPANTVYSPPNGFLRKYRSKLKTKTTINFRIQNSISKKQSMRRILHGSFVVFASFPISISHGELVKIIE